MSNRKVRVTEERVLKIIVGEPLSVDENAKRLAEMRGTDPERGRQVDRVVLGHVQQMHATVAELKGQFGELKALFQKLTLPPMHTAIFLRLVNVLGDQRLQVRHNEQIFLVAADNALDTSLLRPGDEVYLNSERNCVIDRASTPGLATGETAVIERVLEDGRLLIRDQGAEVMVCRCGALQDVALEAGHVVRWERSLKLAMEQVEAGDHSTARVLDEVDGSVPDTFAGLERTRDGVIDSVVQTCLQPELAQRYGLNEDGQRLLFSGPPGCGKTTMMRVIANRLSQSTGRKCRILSVNGAEWYSPYVGETEQKIQRLFRELGEFDGPAILFLDEVDAIGQARGGAGNVHADRFLCTLLGSLQGFTSHHGLIVIAATNRADVLDPALRERFGREIQIPRPGRDAAMAIFRVHLPADLPYRTAATRESIIDLAVSRFYDPNAENPVARMQLRDGSTREVRAADLMSGRLIEQCCRTAVEAAFQRQASGGEAGICEADMQDAVSDVLDRLDGLLTARNAKNYLTDIPPDLDVTSIEPAPRRIRSHRYLRSVSRVDADYGAVAQERSHG